MSLPLDFEARMRSVKIGLPDSLKPADILATTPNNRASDSVRIFPETVHQVLNSPSGITNTEILEDLGIGTMYATLLRPIDQPLQSTAELLSRSLDPRTPPAFPHTRPAAMLLADTLSYQTSLPLSQKTLFRSIRRKRDPATARRILGYVQDELKATFGTSDDTSSIDQLQQRNSEYQAQVLKSFRDANPSGASRTDLLDALREADPIISVLSGEIGTEIEPYTSPSYREWSRAFVEVVGIEAAKNPQIQVLLSQGQLDNFSEYLRICIWNYLPLSNRDENIPLGENPTFTIAGNYFLTHPEISASFWTYLAQKGSEVLVAKPAIETMDDKKNPDTFYSFLNTSLLMQWALTQDRKTFDAFVDTFENVAKDIYVPKERNMLIGRLIFIASHMKTTHPGNENLDNLISRLKGSVELFGIQKEYGEAVEIASDQVPGIIYQRPKGGLGFQALREGQTNEKLIEELTKKDNIVVYVSSAPWQEKKPDLFVSTRTAISVGLGQVGEIIDPRELPDETRKLDPAEALLPHLARTMVYPKGYLQAIDSIQASGRNPRTLARLILFPDMLPLNHPLRLLSHAGIVAVSRYRELIEPNAGVEEFETTVTNYQPPAEKRRRNAIDLVVNAKRADRVNVVSGNKTNLWLQGELYGSNLVIEGLIDPYSRFRYPTLLRVVESAVSFLSNLPAKDQELSEDDVRDLRAISRAWRQLAPSLGLPGRLSIVENLDQVLPNHSYALTPLITGNRLLKIEG